MIKTLCYLRENMYFYKIKQTDTMGYAEIAQLEIMNAAANVASQDAVVILALPVDVKARACAP